MKISTLVLSASLSLLSVSTFASNIEFEPVDNKLETQACHAAATDGIKAAKTLMKANNINFSNFDHNIMCNDMTISDFASKYARIRAENNDQNESRVVRIVALSAMDQSVESQLCLDAVTMGEMAAREKHDIEHSGIRCNGKPISTFLKSLKNIKVVNESSDNQSIAKL